MSSTRVVNFSVRQNKAIERALAFEGLRRFTSLAPAAEYLYVGLGSVWFVDFEMAHCVLGIDTLISSEADQVTHRRAVFNRPYRSVEVEHGMSDEVIPRIMNERPDLLKRPWIVWLDYDSELDHRKLAEFDGLIDRLPPGSALLTTFNAMAGRYARPPAERKAAFDELLGDAFPTERFTAIRKYKDDSFVMDALADGVLAMMNARAIHFARPGGFVKAFKLKYQDGAPMVTVGGFLPAAPDRVAVEDEVATADWPCLLAAPITTPPLTIKETQALKSILPANPAPTRGDVQALGFDLDDEQIDSFVRHYQHFPTFVQALR